MKLRPYVSSGWGLRTFFALLSIDILSLLGSFYNPFLPIVFAFVLWFSAVLGILLFFSRSGGDADLPVRWIRISRTGVSVENQARIGWDSVSGVNLSIFKDKITTGPRIRAQALNAKAVSKTRPMSGGGFVPELTRTAHYGVLSVYTSYNNMPALEFKCRIPLMRPQRILNRVRRIGKLTGTEAVFSFNTHHIEHNLSLGSE